MREKPQPPEIVDGAEERPDAGNALDSHVAHAHVEPAKEVPLRRQGMWHTLDRSRKESLSLYRYALEGRVYGARADWEFYRTDRF